MKAKVTPQALLEDTRDLFSGSVIRATYVTPESGEATETSIKTALRESVAADNNARLAVQSINFADLPPIGAPGDIVLRTPHGLGDVERIEFGNGVKALLLANDHEPGRVAVKVRFGAGLRAFDAKDAPYIGLGESALVQSGLGDLGQEELDRISTGRKMGFDFEIGEGTFSFSAMTRRQDLADQLYLFAAKLGMPRWDPNPVARAKAAGRLAYQSYEASPSGVLNRDLEYYIYNKNPIFRTSDPEALANTSVEGFREVWEPILQQGPIEILIFGDYDREEAVAALSRTFGALPDRKPISQEVLNRDFEVASAGETVVRYHKGEANQAAAVIAWPVGGGVAEMQISCKYLEWIPSPPPRCAASHLH